MKHDIFLPIKKYLATSHKRIKNMPRKGVISKFAEKVGLLYFGMVNQHSDEHEIVRGLTVSSTHHDNHFCIGTVNGYNVSIVNRSDVKHIPDGRIVPYDWLIFAVELKTQVAIPHFFINAKNTDHKPYAALFSTYPNMKEVDLSAFKSYDSEFCGRFTVYARPAKTQDIQQIITADTAKVLGAHFWPLAIEQHNNVLYLYSTHEKITSSLLETMLENGLWLARQLDLEKASEA